MEDMTATTVYFAKKGSENTEKTLKLAHQRITELGINQVVLASHTGNTALKAVEVFQDSHLIVVTHSVGFRELGKQQLTQETRQKLEKLPNVDILTTTHAFGGVGRAVRMKLGTYQVDEVIAYTLRTFCQGVKVCCELTIMAADAGLLDMTSEVLAIAGSGSGADTAMIIKPAHAQNYLDLKALEIICKPREG
ncbi:pyruvate kinase alpha/beta domain-containing protein [[Eubacterium] cellulosolvens]